MPDSLSARALRGATRLAEAGRLPDSWIRLGIRAMVADRARGEARAARTSRVFAEWMRSQPVAIATDEANDQHYAVAPAFFETVLGPRLKYSCCDYSSGASTLPEAEDAMLATSCERAGIEDGMRVLDLGCGWGSMTTWIAEHFPNCEVLAVSNSSAQRGFITDRCAKRGFENVEVITANAATLELEEDRFDRVVSVEMFEHMRNWPELYTRIACWLAPGGRFFQHVFCHRQHPYPFEDDGEADWMARNFFSGGIMPSRDLPNAVAVDNPGTLEVERSWSVSGVDYARTSRAWLERLDAHRSDALGALAGHPDGAEIALGRWRLFFMACEELFAYRGGTEWLVGHYRLRSTAS